jgi:hypothetical protein
MYRHIYIYIYIHICMCVYYTPGTIQLAREKWSDYLTSSRGYLLVIKSNTNNRFQSGYIILCTLHIPLEELRGVLN